MSNRTGSRPGPAGAFRTGDEIRPVERRIDDQAVSVPFGKPDQTVAALGVGLGRDQALEAPDRAGEHRWR